MASSWGSRDELAQTWCDRNVFSYNRQDKGEAGPEFLTQLLQMSDRTVQELDSVAVQTTGDPLSKIEYLRRLTTGKLAAANAQDKTIGEARENIRKAIELILMSNLQLAKKEPSDKNVICRQIKVNV